MTTDDPSEPPDHCQYAECEADPTGALDFYFGVRWYCTGHFHEMKANWNHQVEVTVMKTPEDNDT